MSSLLNLNRSKVKSKQKLSEIYVKTKIAIARAKLNHCDIAIIPNPDQTTINYLIACGYAHKPYSNGRSIVRLIA